MNGINGTCLTQGISPFNKCNKPVSDSSRRFDGPILAFDVGRETVMPWDVVLILTPV